MQDKFNTLDKILRSKRLSSWLTILGFLIFLVPFFQIPGIASLSIGWIMNVKSDRAKRQKILWTLPIVIIVLLALYIVLFT